MARSPLVTFRLPEEHREHLRLVAKRNGTTVAGLIADALQKAGYLTRDVHDPQEESAA